MKPIINISDEELAAYMDGMLSEKASAAVESFMDLDDFEVLNVSRKAVETIDSGSVVQLPSWRDVAVACAPPSCADFAMAGFLGDTNAEEAEEMEGAEEKGGGASENTAKEKE